jgi:hypothetical protein
MFNFSLKILQYANGQRTPHQRIFYIEEQWRIDFPLHRVSENSFSAKRSSGELIFRFALFIEPLLVLFPPFTISK